MSSFSLFHPGSIAKSPLSLIYLALEINIPTMKNKINDDVREEESSAFGGIRTNGYAIKRRKFCHSAATATKL